MSPEVAFAPLVEQMQALASELFCIRECALADDQDYVGEQIKCQPSRLRNFKRQLNERMASFERKLSDSPDPDWIEEGLGRFENYAGRLSAELSALRGDLAEPHHGFCRQLEAFQMEVDARVETFTATIRGRTR